MILLGILLGFVWRRSPERTRYQRFFTPMLLGAIATIALAAVLPLGWPKFLVMLLQAPLVGGTITARAAQS